MGHSLVQEFITDDFKTAVQTVLDQALQTEVGPQAGVAAWIPPPGHGRHPGLDSQRLLDGVPLVRVPEVVHYGVRHDVHRERANKLSRRLRRYLRHGSDVNQVHHAFFKILTRKGPPLACQ